MVVISQILPKIGCHGNVPWDIKKEVQIDHLHLKRFHSVKRLRKLVQQILSSFVSEKSLKKMRKKKKKEIMKLWKVKYTARSACLPSGLNKYS